MRHTQEPKMTIRRGCALLLIPLLLPRDAGAQQCVTPADGIVIPSDSSVRLCPGVYPLSDPGWDGVIRVENAAGVTIDGTGVQLSGPGRSGYALLVRNSSRVTIRNFPRISGYFYAVRVEGSDSVVIESCTAFGNARDDAGFIDVWGGVDQAHGGAVLFDRSTRCSVRNCSFTGSNDGVALYGCTHMAIANNDLSTNTAFAIRMFHSDSCTILDNDGSHTYRENPVNSDAGAILMIVSNENRIEGNDFSHSSDGVFLGQYAHHLTPNNNVFIGNDCSYSPHNAFEATFASGNTFRRNKANYSGYGFWLGYSFNTVVDSNEIIGNREALSVGTAGIAIDRGYNNVIRDNLIDENAVGVLVWRGDPIPGYESQPSERYLIEGNTFAGNVRAVDVSGTEDVVMEGNRLLRNYDAILLGPGNTGVTLGGNIFGPTVMSWISNTGVSDIQASSNIFPVADTAVIRSKIHDRDDDPGVGTVFFVPFDVLGSGGVESTIPEELTEPGGGLWSVFASDGAQSTARWDSGLTVSGDASLAVLTESGSDVNVHRWPAAGLTTAWDLADRTALTFRVYALNPNGGGFQEFSVRLGNEGGASILYTADAGMLSGAIGQWRKMEVPLAGSGSWHRTTVGHAVLDSIAYVEIHADTWGGGFSLWLDEMRFEPVTSVPSRDGALPSVAALEQNYPNPFNPVTTLAFVLPSASLVRLTLHDLLGREVREVRSGREDAGRHELTVDASGLPSGMYVGRLVVRPLPHSAGDDSAPAHRGTIHTRKLLLVR
jgi:parallel beta-helix repeat protein